MSGALQVQGLKEFRTELEALDGNWVSQLSLTHQKIASIAANAARAKARSMGRMQAKGASAIGERHTTRTAVVAVLPSRVDAMANIAFFGAKRHTGWYNAPRYEHSRRQFRPWVGNSWEVAGPGGPYAINPALAEKLPTILDLYLDMIDELARRAFPGR